MTTQGFLDNQNYYDAYATPQGRVRKQLANTLLTQATKSEPVYGWGQALAKVLAGGVAGWQMGDVADQEQKNMQSAPGDIASAYSSAADQWKNPDTGESVGPDKMQNFALLAGKSANPFVQSYGAQNAMAGIQNQQAAALKKQELADTADQQIRAKNAELPDIVKMDQYYNGEGNQSAAGGSPALSADPNTPPLSAPDRMNRLMELEAAKKGQGGQKLWSNANQQDVVQDQAKLDALRNSQILTKEMRKEITNADPSMFGPGSEKLNNLLSLGIQSGLIDSKDPRVNQIASLQDFNKLAAQNTVAQSGNLKGGAARSVTGLKLLTSGNPGNTNTVQGLNKILDSLDMVQNKQADYINGKTNYRSQPGKLGAAQGWDEQYAKQIEDELAAQQQNNAPPAPQVLNAQPSNTLGAPGQPTPAEIKTLQSNPSVYAPLFDKYHGAGASQKVLGQTQSNNLPIDGSQPVVTPQPSPAGAQSLIRRGNEGINPDVVNGLRQKMKAQGRTDREINAYLAHVGLS